MSTPASKPRLSIGAIPLICLLCATAGSVDAAVFLLRGQVFVANMTGNTVLLAISLLQHEYSKAALRLGLVATFLAGVVTAQLLTRIAGERATRRSVLLSSPCRRSYCSCLCGKEQQRIRACCFFC
jgi:uncharacterized membrane protein YoaK (UPF0700 family)